MRVGSLFAGIGGFDLGFERAGMETAWQVELDAKCRELLAVRFPRARQYEDVRQCGAANLEPVDMVCGGFPCQDLSVAGKRAGLAGERSGLFYEMTRIVDELQPSWLVWENVPGLLSSHRGSDFASVLVELERIGYHGAWSTLDARYFGVAQRRRRIFGVFARGDSGAERAAAVLALAARLRGNPAPGRAEGAGVAGEPDVGFALRRDPGGIGQGHNTNFVPQTTGTLNPGAHPGSYNGQDAYTDMLIANTVRAADGHHGRSSPRGDGSDNIVPTLRVGGREQGAGSSYDNTPIVVQPLRAGRQFSDMGDGSSNVVARSLALRGREGGVSAELGSDDKANALRGSNGGRCGEGAGAIAFNWQNGGGYGEAHDGMAITEDGTGPLSRSQVQAVATSGVRRLTPTECERLQGFPDGWTEGFADTHRYRMLGNAVAVPCAAWIGKRLVGVE